MRKQDVVINGESNEKKQEKKKHKAMKGEVS